MPILNESLARKLAHPINLTFIICFLLWIIHNFLVLSYKVDKERNKIKKEQAIAIARLYPKDSWLSH